MKRLAGRPSEYTLEMAERICDEIVSGRTLNEIGGREGFPSRCTVYHWLEKYSEFVELYERAKLAAADFHVDRTLEIADDTSGDDGNDSVQRSGLQVKTRQWIASRLAPHRYGDFNKTEVNHTGKVELGLGDVLREIAGRTRGIPLLESPEPAE